MKTETLTELDDFKNAANVYYQQLTKASQIKGLGSHEHIYFTYGIEWAFNRLYKYQNNHEALLSALKETVEAYEYALQDHAAILNMKYSPNNVTISAKKVIKQAEQGNNI